MESKIIDINSQAPDFTLPTFSETELISLANFRNSSNIIVYFYPKDNTPGCTTESIEFSQQLLEFESLDCKIIGISKDSQESHCKFRDKYNLNITLASDDQNVCQLYNCWVEKSMFGKKYWGIERSTFIIDKQGIIRYIWRKVKVKSHVQEVLKQAKQLFTT